MPGSAAMTAGSGARDDNPVGSVDPDPPQEHHDEPSGPSLGSGRFRFGPPSALPPAPVRFLPASRTARDSTYSICPLTLRSSSEAHASSASQRRGSMRRRNAFRGLIADRSPQERPYLWSVPVFTTGVTARSPQSTTSRFDTMAACRSASRSTMFRSFSR